MSNHKAVIPCVLMLLCFACTPPTITQIAPTPTTPWLTATPWPDAPILRSPLDIPFTCTGTSLEVAFEWSPSRSEHPVQRYLIQIEGAMEETGSWKSISSDFVSNPSFSMELACNVAVFYRWRVQTQDIRGSIGPWSGYAFFSLVPSEASPMK
ncbi:MAG: hypothetical protein JXA33_19485 [Anaerolineae bacterium]|nr:hypothetical protein [Anaerolineae bacterium]